MAQKRIVLKHCGMIDPGLIDSYIEKGGFDPLRKAMTQMNPDTIINEIKISGLTGRGGAGFSCGIKWDLARKAGSSEKYLICNADEGEIGTFKDRYILTHDPFTLIEGMAIAGYAIGITSAFIYLRDEYHYLHDRLTNAIEQAREKGFLNHMGLQIFEGAGAYICGEESALMNSLQGLRGESRFKPPFPPSQGLWEQPTIINNVETLMNIPHIIQNGASWFSQLGTAKSKGTKVFSVCGDVARPGVYELVMGSRLKELVVDIAGGEDLKAVQVGGASGKILPRAMIDIPLSHETVLGSGGILVLNNSRDIIDFVYKDLEFLNEESCGKCTPCREGTEVMVEILGRLNAGDGTIEDIDALKDLSQAMSLSSLCGLGQAAPIPVLDSLKYFHEDYAKRIEQAVFLRNYQGGHPK
jgi:NADH-quinone oxidoreductase subunit F